MQQQRTFSNPIKSGFYPDPSVCRVGDDFYLVTSTFAYVPGVPIFHSRDLVNWRQIGHVLDRPSQLPLTGAGTSEGIFAPTLRHHDGTFYMITTNVSGGGNFYVTATDPAGPWSEPVSLPEAQGIDPTIFFDDDGKAWYLGTRPAPEGPRYFGNWEVWIQELDLESGKLVGESTGLWRGALKEAVWPEGPHLYRRDGFYYLMIAEGGTGPNHAITMARSRELCGPYEGNRNNPILTHRHLGNACPVTNVGHADIVETASGETWVVLLASRPWGGPFRNLGRETFLVPAVWEDGWLVIAPGVGKIEDDPVAPDLPWTPWPAESGVDHFDGPTLGMDWVHLRNPEAANYDLATRPGSLTLRLSKADLRGKESPSAIFRRQTSISFLARTALEFSPDRDGESAGLVIRQNEDFQVVFERTRDRGSDLLRVVSIEKGVATIAASVPYPATSLVLSMEQRVQELFFRWKTPGGEWQDLASGLDARLLSTDRAGGFVGTMLGLFATANGPGFAANGANSATSASFDWFSYEQK